MPQLKVLAKIDKFYQGFSPVHFKNSLSSYGNVGHANAMTNVNILTPEFLTQGPALADLTNGTQAGVVTDLVRFILDQVVTSGVSYGISNTKLHKLSATTVSSGGIWPHTISGASRGESIFIVGGNLYYVWQTNIGKYNLSTTFDDDWGQNGVSSGGAQLQDAPHPVDVKEDLALIGNGRYLCVYNASSDTLSPTKLDFGPNTEVVDIKFHKNYWYIAVNSTNANDSNRGHSRIFLYDASAISTLLSDEISLGAKKIGFMEIIDGIIYVAYQDLTTGAYAIGYLAGNMVKHLGYFTGSLPDFKQKTLYNNVLLFVSGSSVWAAGAISDELPFAISQIADAGYNSNVGALAAPFGTPMVASDDTSSYRLAKFSGYDTNCDWTSLIIDLAIGKNLAFIDSIVVYTNTLSANAQLDITLKYNDESSNSGAKVVDTDSQRRHIIPIGKKNVENVRAFLDFSNGNATNQVEVRSVEIIGYLIRR